MLAKLRGSRKSRAIVALLSSLVLVAALAGYVSAGSGDGTGSMDVTTNPTTTVAGAPGQTLNFTYTSSYDFTGYGSSGSEIRLYIPTGWTQPQNTSATGAGYVTVSGTGNCSPGAVTINTSANPSGWRIDVPMSCHSGDKISITYGAGTSTAKVTAPTTAGTTTFETQSQYGGSGLADLAPANQAKVTVVAGAATQVRVETAANGSGSVVAAQNLTSGNSLTVYAISRDGAGNFVANVAATWSLQGITGGVVAGDLVASGDTKSATLSGHLTGSATIRAVAGFTGNSNTITVVAGAASKLVITSVNGGSNVTAGTGFSVIVQAQDAGGNPVNVTASTGVSLGLKTGTGTLGGTTTGSISNGHSSVTITGVTYTKAESGVVLTASRTSGMSLTAGDSAPFTVVAGAATQVRVETAANGSGSVVAAQNLTSGNSLTVYAISRDGAGNFVANVAATWSLQGITGGVVAGDLVASGDTKSATLSGHLTGSATIRAVAGFTGNSNTITVVAGAATQVRVETAANGSGSVVAAQNLTSGNSLTVYAISRDGAGNFVANVAATWSLQGITGGVVAGDLVASGDTKSATLSGHLTGSATIRAVAGFTGNSNTITVVAGAASKLVITTQPSTTTVGATITPALAVAITDANGNTVNSTANISIAIQTGGGSLGGTTSHNAVAGVATFDNLTISNTGSHTLRATSNGLTRVDSASFNITDAPVTVTFYTRLCSAYTQVPANLEPTTNYGGGWNGNDTGGHNAQLNTTLPNTGTNATVANNTTDLVCNPYTGTWQFNMWNAQDAAHHTGGNPTLQGTATTSGAAGSTTITLSAAEVALARGSGLWITQATDPSVAGFAAIRCYDDIHYSDNSETVALPAGVNQFYCIAYNVKPQIAFGPLGPVSYGVGTVALSATTTATGAGPAINFTVDNGPCSVVGTTLSVNGVGTCKVTAHEAQVPGTTNFWSAATDVSQDLIVNPGALTITANNRTKTFGDTLTLGTTAYTVTGSLAAGDSITGVTLTSAGAASGAAVGSYDIVPSAATGTGLANYNITYANGSLTVGARPTLLITANNRSKTFGDTLDLGTTAYTVTGTLAAGDSITGVTLASTGAAAGAAIGTYDIVPSAATGTGLDKYDITYVNGTLTVSARPTLLITANNQTKTLGQALDLGTTAFTITGTLAGGDSITGVTLTSAGAATGAAVGTYDIVPSAATGTGLDKYDITYANGTLTVGAKPILTVTANDQSRDANVGNPALTFTVTGYLAGDDDSAVTTQPVCTTTATATSAPGVYPITCSGAASSTYDFVYVAGSLTVTGQLVGGVTAAPVASATPPVTTVDNGSPIGGSTPLIALLICFAFGALGLLAVQAQRRSLRS